MRLIDAKSAINDLCGSQCGCRIDDCGRDEPCEQARCILRQPTIEPEVRHGRWIEDHTDLICSVCKWKYSAELPLMSNHGLDSMTEAFAHCPHFGAKLDAEDTNVLTNDGGELRCRS